MLSIRWSTLSLLLAALLLAAIPAAATTYVMADDDALLEQAQLVVDARVTAVEPAPVSGRPSTDYTIEVERLLSGSAPGTTLIVRALGGVRDDGVGFHVYGAPELRTGDRAILFLVPRDDGTFGILHLVLGAFRRVQRPGAPALGLRNLSEAVEVAQPGAVTDQRLRGPRDYDAFADWLADRAQGVDRPADYFVDSASLGGVLEKYTLFRSGGRNMRWFEFDTGGAVQWRLHSSGQPNLAGGGEQQLRQALAAWGLDSATPIRLEFAGRSGSRSGFEDFDGQNVLLPGDPNQEIPGMFACNGGGTLAIGGPWFDSTELGTFRDQEYIRILGADIIVNDGIECMRFLSDCFGSRVASVYAHEVGHTLGIGHSCGDSSSPSCSDPLLNDALMRATAHLGCRGATLADDDRSAARRLYRQPENRPRGPNAPVGLTGALEGSAVSLSWEDRSEGELGFRVYRSSEGSGFSLVGVASPDVERFVDRAILPATAYRYRVASFDARGEGRSATIDVVVPPAPPVTVALRDLPGLAARVGEPVELVAVFSGPAAGAEWRFGDSGVGFNDTRCGADTFCRTHVFTTPGTHTVEVTIEGTFGQVARDTVTVTVEDAPFETASESTFLQSVIFGRRGDTGTFESDVWLYNAGEVPAVVEMVYLPRGAEPASEPLALTIDPAESISLPNVLDKVFDVSAGQGAVELTTRVPAGSEPRVLTISRSFVALENPAEGSFGQFVGGDVDSRWTAGDKVATGILNGDGFVATLLAANVDERPGRVEMTLTDRDGRPVGEPALYGLGPKTVRFRPLAELFPEVTDREGPFTARFSSNGIRFVASSTLLETGSEDQIFVPAEAPDQADPAGTEIVVPRVVRSPGQFGVFLTSSLSVFNAAGTATDLTFQLLERGQANKEPLEVTRTVAAGEVLFFEDLVDELFDLEIATGALRVLWSNGQDVPPRVVAMTLSESPRGGRFGMLVPGRRADDATADRGVVFGSEQSDVFRSQLGIVNLRNGRTEVRLTLRDGNGDELRSTTVVLAARQHLELNLATVFQGVADGTNRSVTTEVVGGGPVMTYLANINASGDVFLVPGRPIL